MLYVDSKQSITASATSDAFSFGKFVHNPFVMSVSTTSGHTSYIESGLLNIIGLGMNLECDAETGETIDPDGIYDYVANHGPTRVAGAGTASSVRGATLLALAGQVAWGIAEGREAKRLMRYVLDHHLDGRPLAARELFSTSRERKT